MANVDIGDSLTCRELTRQLANAIVDRRGGGNEWKQTTEYCGGQQYHLQRTNERIDLSSSDAGGGLEGRPPVAIRIISFRLRGKRTANHPRNETRS